MSVLDSIADDLRSLRRELHQIPELGLDLPQTQARLLQELDGLPLEITTGEKLSSITAVLRGGKAGPDKRVVLLRGDMDGLPIKEETGLDYASTNGNMHACGHDLHMAILVGAVKELCSRKDELPGDVIFMFQPGEEGYSGADVMLKEGVLDAAGVRPTAAYGIHVWSAQDPLGMFASMPGTMMASADGLEVRVEGKGGHGSTPHLAIDPVPVIAEMVTATHQMVTRRHSIFDPVVVTVGKMQAGSASNVIPEFGEFACTLRAYSPEAKDKMLAGLYQLFEGIAAAHGVNITIERTQAYPVTVNSVEGEEAARQAVVDLFGEDRYTRWTTPLAGAEDFSYVLEEVPGCFVGLSACPADLDPATAAYNHSAYAKFDDCVVPDGARLLSELAVRHLSEQ